MVMVWSIDRIGRSLQNLVEILSKLLSLMMDLYFQQQGLDTNTPSGRMMFSVFGALAEFGRSPIRERVVAGQQWAKAKGKKLGRPSKRNEGLKTAIQLLRQKGMGIKQTAKECGVGVGTVYSVI